MAELEAPLSLGDSLVHHLDPRARLLAATAFSLPTALATDFRAALLALALGGLILVLAKPSPLLVLKRFLAVNLFIAFLWLFIPFSLPGQALFHLGPLAYTREGVRLALLLTLKSNAAFLALLALVGTIPVQQLGSALQALGLPDKICHLLLFSYRYLFVIRREYLRLLTAAEARGFRPRTNALTYRTYAWLLGMLLVKSWDRAERVHQAMLCRGFHGRFYCLADFVYQRADAVFLGAALVGSAAVAWLDILGRIAA